jgi:hypothetical protein
LTPLSVLVRPTSFLRHVGIGIVTSGLVVMSTSPPAGSFSGRIPLPLRWCCGDSRNSGSSKFRSGLCFARAADAPLSKPPSWESRRERIVVRPIARLLSSELSPHRLPAQKLSRLGPAVNGPKGPVCFSAISLSRYAFWRCK